MINFINPYLKKGKRMFFLEEKKCIHCLSLFSFFYYYWKWDDLHDYFLSIGHISSFPSFIHSAKQHQSSNDLREEKKRSILIVHNFFIHFPSLFLSRLASSSSITISMHILFFLRLMIDRLIFYAITAIIRFSFPYSHLFTYFYPIE